MENAILRNNKKSIHKSIPNPTISFITPPICKIKYEIFGDYQIIGLLPYSFNELTKIISGVVYPNNFSLDYFGEGFMLISLNASNYKNLLKFSRDQFLREIKLFVNVHESEEDADFGTNGKIFDNFSRNLSPKKRKNTLNSNYATYIIKETSENSSTSHENSSVASINSDSRDSIKYKKVNCVCRGRTITPKTKKSEKFYKNRIYCF